MVRVNPNKMRYNENHSLFRNVEDTVLLKNDKPKRIISSEDSHLS